MLEWLKKVPSWLYTVLVVGALAFVARNYRRRMLSSQARASLDVELAKIEAAKADRAKLDMKRLESWAEIANFDEAILASKREVVALHESVEGLDAKAIADRFSKLGL